MTTTRGRVLHRAAWYDFTVWLMMLGRERSTRARWLDLARLAPGEAVLDIGCGTGTLALAAADRVAPNGTVHGIDPSGEMLARARSKARKRAAAVTFEEAAAETLPFPDERFDVVLSTVMLHHLPRKVREACLAEVRRVLRPGGRLLVVDFGESPPRGHGPLRHLRHRHGHVDPADLLALVAGAGLHVVEHGPVGMRALEYVLATREALHA